MPEFKAAQDYFHPALPFYTLLKKEILRFWSVALQTLVTPFITASLYLLVFGLSLGNKFSVIPEFTYIQFVVPGLVLMGVINNSFANTSSSLFFSRYLGNIVDLLVTPITPAQFIMAYTIAAMIRGILVGVSVLAISLVFTPLPWAHPFAAFAMVVLASFLFAQLGLIAAIFSNSFDALSMYTNFLILPLIYLGGLFYPISLLPGIWKVLSHFNPLFYLIDGFRQAVLGRGDTELWVDFLVAGGISAVLFALAAYYIGKGHKMRT